MPVKRGLRALVPDMSDYVDAFRLAALPAVAVTLAIGMMTHVGGNIQGTFYIVWLNEVGISGSLIGALISIANLKPSRLVATVSRLRSSGGAKAIECKRKSIDPSSSRQRPISAAM